MPGIHTIIRADLVDKTTEPFWEPEIRLVSDGTRHSKMNLQYPTDLFFCNNNLYIYFQGNKLLIDATNPLKVKWIAGTGADRFQDGPPGTGTLPAWSGTQIIAGNAMFLDVQNSALRVFNGQTVSTICGKGSFESGFREGLISQCLFQRPTALAEFKRNIYIIDYYNKCLRKWNQTNQSVQRVQTFHSLVNCPICIAAAEDNIYTITRQGTIYYSHHPDSSGFDTLPLKNLKILPKFRNDLDQPTDTITMDNDGPIDIMVDEKILEDPGSRVFCNQKPMVFSHGKATAHFRGALYITIQYLFEFYETGSNRTQLKRGKMILKAGTTKGGRNKLSLPIA
jgi:hypothetical protein